MTRHTLLIGLLFICFSTSATSITDQRCWEEGPLTWNDFKGNPMIKNQSVYLSAELLHDEQIFSIGNRESFSISAKAVMHPSRSYADTSIRSNQMLRYLQAQFDILEIMRRRYQKELAGGISGIEADHRQIAYTKLYESEIERLSRETEQGLNDATLQYFEYEIRRQLEEIGLPPVPNVVPSNFKYGFFIGTGAVFNLGELNNAFSWTWDFYTLA